MSKLLSRDEFRESVFKRDGHKCVMCSLPAVDAHHLLERKLFEGNGNYVENGVSLCEEHHWAAEKNEILPDELRTAAGIKIQILPVNLPVMIKYNKWGEAIDIKT